MTESYIIPEFDENGNFLSDDVKARIAEMIESYIIPEFDENGNFLRDDVKARIAEMIEAHAPAPAPSNPGPEIITLKEGHPNLAGTLAEPLPDDLPVGSYLINAPRFMGYRLTQKTPLGWDIKDFKESINYQIPSTASRPLRAWVMRGSTPIVGATFTGTVTPTADSLHISFSIYNVNFTKGEEVTVLLESPNYDMLGYTAVSYEYVPRNGDTASEVVTHYLLAIPGGAMVEGKYTNGLSVQVLAGRSQANLSVAATFGLGTPPDIRAIDKMYVPPSERVEVEVPEPTVVEASDHMSSTVTIPEVEGVTWSASFRNAQGGGAEPGVYEVLMADAQKFTVTAVAEKGYYIKNNDGTQVPWKTKTGWSYSQGLPLTVPMPVPLNATTEGGVNGWIVRYPEVEHVRYSFMSGYGSSGAVWTAVTGDAFTPINKSIRASADPPYYVTNSSLGSVRTNGAIN